ncbi:restriction endonuclease subunit S [Flavobacterium columnare]|uniref:restriction endonuclease subunit S n=1 Tax=Flavobacterium columnare TaxID=996 RepID=UPI004033BA56
MKEATQNINSNKFFLINRSELEGRIDPHQYHFERRNAIDKIKAKNDILKLKHVVKNVKKVTSEINANDIYIGLENIESNTGEYIATNDKQSISSAGVFKKGQILFPKLRPYLNKVYLTEFDGLCSTEFHIFQSEKFDNDFLSIYLRSDLIVNQTKHLMTGNTLPRLQTEDINNLPVPKISIDRQKQIVELYNTANLKKQIKEKEAQELLNCIDSFILNEVGITLPKKEDNIESRIFIANFSEMVGSRLDPKLYDINTKKLKEAIINSKFPKIQLKQLIVNSVAGDWGKDVDENFDEDELNNFIKCLVIRATEFDNNANLNLDNTRVKYRFINKEKLKRIDIKENDLLIEKSGGSPDQPVGRIAIITKNILEENQLCYSNFIHKIRVDSKKIIPHYLFYFLKTAHNIKITDSMQSQTNGIRNLIMSNYFNQNIILPDMKKQQEIVTHINNIQQQIKSLQTEAKQVLEEAKQEVEKMILG